MNKSPAHLRKSGRGDAAALALFDKLLPAPSWRVWKACVSAILGLPVTDEQAELIRKCTERVTSPRRMAREIWIICGRRAGKSQIAALLAVYLAVFKRYRRSPGERLVGMLLAADRRQSRVLKGYISGLLHAAPELERLIAKETGEAIELTNGITIEIHTSSFRSVRGYTCIFVIGDEVAFWPSDGPETDTETLNALRPTLATTGGPLICLSTPYARVGALYEAHSRHFGVDDDEVLVWVAPTLTMNSTIDPRIVDRAYADDPEAASSEWGAAFRSDLQMLFAREVLAACVVAAWRELPPQPGALYFAHCDTSGGSDESFGLSIAHKDERGIVVVDLAREWPAPFDPSVVVAEVADILRRYHITTLRGDRYSAEWIVSAFARHAISYEPNELTKSQLFIETLSMVNARQVELLDQPRLLAQFAGLQRRTGRSGKDSIDHKPGQRDDLANAVAGCLVLCIQSSGRATLPPDFTCCARKAAIPSFDLTSCYLFGLPGGMFPGSTDPHTCGSCTGHRYAKAAAKAYTERTGEAVSLRMFTREHLDLEANEFVARIVRSDWMGREHGL